MNVIMFSSTLGLVPDSDICVCATLWVTLMWLNVEKDLIPTETAYISTQVNPTLIDHGTCSVCLMSYGVYTNVESTGEVIGYLNLQMLLRWLLYFQEVNQILWSTRYSAEGPDFSTEHLRFHGITWVEVDFATQAFNIACRDSGSKVLVSDNLDAANRCPGSSYLKLGWASEMS